ncbi:MAG: hypothetical protein QNJ85_01890 [Gammaproteobacteria bacterium]|nr:hypothetical protein [Gammaproteobacteria bacterium]
MQPPNFRPNRRLARNWYRLRDRLLFVPGALVLAYGIWLSLNP